MERIELTLKNSKQKSYHVIGWLLAFMNVLAQFILTWAETYRQDRIFVACIFLVMLLFIFVKREGFRVRKDSIALVYVLICALWIKWEVYWFAGLTALFYILYLYSTRKFEIIIARDAITYPSVPKRKIRWNELQHIILKDGILTIDLKNNKILQNEIEEHTDLNEQEFNELCREQLKK